MKKRAGFVVACAAALLVCSCTPQADVERAKADAAAARAEAERLRADVEELKTKEAAREKVKADAEKAKADAEAAKQKAAALEEEMRKRWNAAVGDLTLDNPDPALPGFRQLNFRWGGPNAFPHPTFKGGSAGAYTAFAKVLVTFLETGDNFEFMRKNDLFTADIGFGGTGKIKIVEFAGQLAAPGSLGAGDEDNRKKLTALVAKMKAPAKA